MMSEGNHPQDDSTVLAHKKNLPFFKRQKRAIGHIPISPSQNLFRKGPSLFEGEKSWLQRPISWEFLEFVETEPKDIETFISTPEARAVPVLSFLCRKMCMFYAKGWVAP